MSNELLNKKFNLRDIVNNEPYTDELLSYVGLCNYRISRYDSDKGYNGNTNNIKNRLFNSLFGHITRYLDESNKSHLYNAIRKHGLDKFYIEITYLPESVEVMKSMQVYFITLFNDYNEGYNQNYNGEGYSYKSQVKNRITINKDGVLKYINTKDKDYYLSEGWELGMGNLSMHSPEIRAKVQTYLKENKLGIYGLSKEVKVNSVTNSCKDILDYLVSNNLDINEINWNSNRDKSRYKSLNKIPKFHNAIKWIKEYTKSIGLEIDYTPSKLVSETSRAGKRAKSHIKWLVSNNMDISEYDKYRTNSVPYYSKVSHWVNSYYEEQKR